MIVPTEIEAARKALENCGEESRMVHRDHLIAVLAAYDTARGDGAPLARLLAWSIGHKSRTVSIDHPDSYVAGCWTVTLGHEKGVTIAEEAQFWTLPEDKGGEVEARKQAEVMGVVYAICGKDEDWVGLPATITAALDAFDRGVWGKRRPEMSSRAAFIAGAEAMQTAATLACARQSGAEWVGAAIIRIDPLTLPGVPRGS